MGLISTRNLIIFIIFFIVSTIIVGFRQTAFADLVKTVSPQVGVEAGDTVTIHLEVPGQTQQLRSPADTMLVMDKSGSMGRRWDGLTLCIPGDCKLESAKDALKAFVDQTVEDIPATTPGDYVGLATYSTSATLDFGIANMTAANKTSIKTAIDFFGAGGSTSIGSGMEIANQELLNNARPDEIPKFIVLATDGIQNVSPSPYDNNILQTAIDNDIVVFTVGIGDNVEEGLLKDIACQTDQNRSVAADNCILVSDTTNDPAINDLDSPDHYFLANADNLEDIYTKIANDISGVTSVAVIDQVNTDVAERIVDKNGDGLLKIGDDVTVWSCGLIPVDVTSDNVNMSNLGVALIIIYVQEIGEDQRMCIEFDAKIRDNVSPGSYPIDSNVPASGCGGVFARRAVFFIINNDCFFEEFVNPDIEVVSPYDPWLKTTGGDVGSFSAIDMIMDAAANNLVNADYLVISDSTIQRFVTNGWIIDGYGGLVIDPDPTSSTIYDEFDKKFTIKKTISSLGDINIGDDAVIVGNNLIITGAVYNGPASVVFVPGDLRITGDLTIGADTGLVFIVEGDIEVTPNVKTIEGVFITNGKFHSRNSSCGGNIPTPNQLVINGAVHAFTELCFTRDLGAQNQSTPAELINYEPKYLYLFQEIVGDPTIVYREVAP